MVASTCGALAWAVTAMWVLLALSDGIRSNAAKANQGKRSKMRDVYMVGAYTTVFKKHPGLSFGDLAREAYMGSPEGRRHEDRRRYRIGLARQLRHGLLGPELDPRPGAVPAA